MILLVALFCFNLARHCNPMAGIRIGEAAHPGPLTFFEELDANLDDHEANGPMPDSDDDFIPYLADSSSDEGERNVADDSTCGLIVGPKKHVVDAKAFKRTVLTLCLHPGSKGNPSTEATWMATSSQLDVARLGTSKTARLIGMRKVSLLMKAPRLISRSRVCAASSSYPQYSVQDAALPWTVRQATRVSINL